MLISTFRPLVVFVRAYVRYRFGKLEQVCSHYRGLPHQLPLFN